MSLTRRPLAETWNKNRDGDLPSEESQRTPVTEVVPQVAQEVAPEVVPETQPAAVPVPEVDSPTKRKSEELDTPQITEVPITLSLEEGKCQTWKRAKKNDRAQQCLVKPRKGHEKCFAHSTNRREVKEQEQTTCAPCLTTVSKGSLKKHQESNRHMEAAKFASEKERVTTAPPTPAPAIQNPLVPPPAASPELEVPKPVPRTMFTPPLPYGGELRLEHLNHFSRGVPVVEAPKKDFSACFGVSTL